MPLKWLSMISNKLITTLCLFICLTSCGCSKERELPDVTPVTPDRYSTGLTFTSTLLNTVVLYDILLPEGYFDSANQDKRYPVMYCFHGYGDNNTSWNGQYMACEGKIKYLESQGLEPMIYVFPNGNNCYWVDRYDGRWPYMTMFVQEFVPMIDATYRTLANREHRGTIGYSMGGFGAMAMAMQHPEVFSMSAPLSMSFRTDEQYIAESQDGWNNQWGRIFGGMGLSGEGRLTDYYKSLCPLHQFTAENIGKYSSVHWFLTCGDNEQQLLIANDDLHVMMRSNGYAHEYRVEDGGHSSSYWKAALEEVLPYFSSRMAGETGWEKVLKTPSVPEDCAFDGDGVFLSAGYMEGGKKDGVALYFLHKGLDATWVKEAMAILQRGMGSKKFVILPCDLEQKTVREWRSFYHDLYPTASKQVIAVGEAGLQAWEARDLFTSFYFDNALLPENPAPDTAKYYYIGQTDDGPHYVSANALYKACKLGGADFEYRCRNTQQDAHADFLSGVEYVKSNLKNL